MTARTRAVKARLHDLERANDGLLLPDVVVEDARREDSPLHDIFEWDDAKAAHAHRLEVARQLIRSVRYEEKTTKTEISTPHYVHVTVAGQRSGYMSVDTVRDSDALSREVLGDEVKRAKAALERARNVADAIGLRSELELAIKQIIALEERVAVAA